MQLHLSRSSVDVTSPVYLYEWTYSARGTEAVAAMPGKHMKS